ncbi:MAG: hypothetical protein FJX46_02770 [Alphaproteobacteria bacterium]|nr:hypothetical protein [Alphaproteobacteria bacterium]
MPATEILIERGLGETRAALLIDGETVELAIAREDDPPPAGNVIAGRVLAAAPDLGGAFVDIGQDLPGFLRCAPPYPPEGRRLALRIRRPQAAGKGARVAIAAETSPGAARPGSVLVPAADEIDRMLRDRADGATAIWVDDAEDLARAPAAKLWREVEPLFRARGVDAAIEAALVPVLAIPGGGRIAIETAAALTAIDIDSQGRKPAEAALAAMDMIARQLRLRRIGGQVAIDPPRLPRRQALLKRLARALADDPLASDVLGFSPMGLIELTRRREGATLAERLGGIETRFVPSPATRAHDLLRAALREARGRSPAGLAIHATAEVLAAIPSDRREQLARRAGCVVTWIEDAGGDRIVARPR